MNRIPAGILLLLSLFTLTGCQCIPWTECYCDYIDDVSDRRPWADHFCHVKLDLTRLGRSDGPACCRPACRRCFHESGPAQK